MGVLRRDSRMISIILELFKQGLGYFIRREEIKGTEVDKDVTTSQQVNETNREDIKKGSFSARSILMIVLSLILLFVYVLVPLVDGFLGVPLFHDSIEPIIRILLALILGS